jgi:hypothetical protein
MFFKTTSTAGMSLTKLSLAGNNYISAGDGKIANLFLQCSSTATRHHSTHVWIKCDFLPLKNSVISRTHPTPPHATTADICPIFIFEAELGEISLACQPKHVREQGGGGGWGEEGGEGSNANPNPKHAFIPQQHKPT